MESGFAFWGLFVGVVVGSFISPMFGKYYKRNPVPETRLYQACLGSILLPVFLLIWAWTSSPKIPAIISILASIPVGASSLFLFLSITDYLVDTYTLFAASALAANTVLRCIVAAAFPLFSSRMFLGVGTEWGMSILAFASILMLPIPWVLVKYGHIIRSKGYYSSGKLI